LEFVCSDRECVVSELASFVTEDLFSINVKKSSLQSEFFSELSDHRIILEFTILYMSSWKYPESSFLVFGHENLTIGIEYECSDYSRK
jgi:hypothetical protein